MEQPIFPAVLLTSAFPYLQVGQLVGIINGWMKEICLSCQDQTCWLNTGCSGAALAAGFISHRSHQRCECHNPAARWSLLSPLWMVTTVPPPHPTPCGGRQQPQTGSSRHRGKASDALEQVGEPQGHSGAWGPGTGTAPPPPVLPLAWSLQCGTNNCCTSIHSRAGTDAMRYPGIPGMPNLPSQPWGRVWGR